MTFVDHLGELRSRLIKSAIAVVIGMAVSAWYIDDIVTFVTSPAGTLYVMRPAEAFLIYMKLALWSGAVLASPILFYQFWAFLLPAFTTHEKRYSPCSYRHRSSYFWADWLFPLPSSCRRACISS